MNKKRRKKRKDRSYVLYLIICLATKEEYIGITVLREGSILKSLQWRWAQHVKRAIREGSDKFPLGERILKFGIYAHFNGFRGQTYDSQPFIMICCTKIRGKAEAYKQEAEIINELNPALNLLKKKAISNGQPNFV